MALTPEDVVTKQFQHVRFKEGFDPDEVDDFLDEIVVEWRKTIAENEELKAKLAAYESGAAPAPAESAPAESAPEPVAEPAPVVEEVPAPVAVAEPVAEPVVDAAPAAASAGIIELAQPASILAEAEAKGRDEIARLESERATLEGRISELRQFERDYRVQLRGFIEEKLRDLDVAGTSSGATPVASAGL
jgi:DivIVA domain-containing protein